MRLSMYASGGCWLGNTSTKCTSTKSGYTTEMQSGADVSIIAFRWDQNYEDENFLSILDALVTEAKAGSTKVIVMAQPPLLNFSPAKIANCDRLGIRCPRPESLINAKYPAYNEAIKQRVTALGADFFDPYTAISDFSKLYDDDQLLYSDMDHLSVYGGKWLYRNSAQVTSGLLTAP